MVCSQLLGFADISDRTCSIPTWWSLGAKHSKQWCSLDVEHLKNCFCSRSSNLDWNHVSASANCVLFQHHLLWLLSALRVIGPPNFQSDRLPETQQKWLALRCCPSSSLVSWRCWASAAWRPSWASRRARSAHRRWREWPRARRRRNPSTWQHLEIA